MTLNESGVQEHRCLGLIEKNILPATPTRVAKPLVLGAERPQSHHQLTDRISKSLHPSVRPQLYRSSSKSCRRSHRRFFVDGGCKTSESRTTFWRCSSNVVAS